MAAEGRSDTVVCDTEVWVRQRSGIEFLCRGGKKKKGAHWHSSILAECLWRPNSGCELSETAGGAFQQWQQWLWAISAGADAYEHAALVH